MLAIRLAVDDSFGDGWLGLAAGLGDPAQAGPGGVLDFQQHWARHRTATAPFHRDPSNQGGGLSRLHLRAIHPLCGVEGIACRANDSMNNSVASLDAWLTIEKTIWSRAV
jgi:hypothetical protein